MKAVIFFLTLSIAICAQAKPFVMNDSLPANATEKIFEMLVKTDNPKAKVKAPFEVKVENLVCTVASGTLTKFKCSAKFANGEQKDIVGDNNIFFEYLVGKKAIALDEVKLGGTTHKAKSLSCRYALDQQPYYRCSSEVSVSF